MTSTVQQTETMRTSLQFAETARKADPKYVKLQVIFAIKKAQDENAVALLNDDDMNAFIDEMNNLNAQAEEQLKCAPKG